VPRKLENDQNASLAERARLRKLGGESRVILAVEMAEAADGLPCRRHRNRNLKSQRSRRNPCWYAVNSARRPRRSYWPFPCPLFVGDDRERPMERDRGTIRTKRERGERENINKKF
jgi:hypothetical protein